MDDAKRLTGRDLLLIALGFAGLYACTLSANHTEAEDALTYAAQVARGSPLWLPNHLAFNGLSWLAWRAWQSCGYAGDPSLPMQVDSLLAGVVSLLLLGRLTSRLGVPRGPALAAILATGLSYGFWWYSVESETYVLAIPFILLAIDRLIVVAPGASRARDCALLGAACSLAILIHQQHVLFALAVLACLALRASRGIPRAAAGTVVCAATLAAVVGSAYLGVGLVVLDLGGLGEVLAWSRGHASNGLWTPWSIASLPKACIGLLRSFNGLNFMFGFDDFGANLARALPTKILLEERFLVEQQSWVTRWGCLVGVGVMSSAGAWFALRWLRAVRSSAAGLVESDSVSSARRLCSLALVLYAVFNLIWEPLNIELWVAMTPVLFLCLAMTPALRTPTPAARRATSAFVAALGLSNLSGNVLPQTRTAQDFWYQANRYLIEDSRPTDLIVSRGGYISDGYLQLFPAGQWADWSNDPVRLGELIDGHHSGRILISSWVQDPLPEIVVSGQVTCRDPGALRALLERYGPRMQVLDRNRWQVVFELKPSAAAD